MDGYLVGIWQILADSYETMNLLPEISGRFLQDNLFLPDKPFSDRISQDYNFSVRFSKITIYLSELDKFLQDNHPVSTRYDRR